MRRIVVKIALSKDGILDSEANGEWAVASDPLSMMESVLESFDTLFFGRAAYEKSPLLRAEKGDDPDDLKDLRLVIRSMRKYVFSRSKRHVAGNGMVIFENAMAQALRIKGEEGKDIWLCGGASIIRFFAEHDMIDHYIIAAHPIELGHRSLPGNMALPDNLFLTRIEKMRSGVTLFHFSPLNRILFQ